ncbi:Iron(III) dicitrate-binding protein [Lachnospiraceae bacterium TWA4]|nr:Iron(III) dicitrate-binding protein [Lachnospiraceae bacterium TWA4]
MKETVKKLIVLLLIIVMASSLFVGCTNDTKTETKKETQKETQDRGSDSETRVVVDATGAEVTVPAHPKKIAIGNLVLPNMVYALQKRADNIASIPPSAYSNWEVSILKDLAPELKDVDTTMVGDDFSMNAEALAAAGVDLAINWEDQTDSATQLKGLGIPVVLVNYAKNLDDLKRLITTLGDALNCKEQADKILSWYNEKEDTINSKSEQIKNLKDEEKPRVLQFQRVEKLQIYSGGMNPFIIDWVGGKNIEVEAGSADNINMETLLTYDPEIIFISNFDKVTPDDFYNNKLEGQDWSNVSAVKNHKVFKVPCGLYRWAPPNSIEKPLYVLWAASHIQPEIFSDINMEDEIKSFFKGFFDYDLTKEQLDNVLHTDLNK